MVDIGLDLQHLRVEGSSPSALRTAADLKLARDLRDAGADLPIVHAGTGAVQVVPVLHRLANDVVPFL